MMHLECDRSVYRLPVYHLLTGQRTGLMLIGAHFEPARPTQLA